MACHGDIETDSVVLAQPAGSCLGRDGDLSMREIQGGEGEEGVRLGPGATVVLSACNTGRGEIKAEGVVGLARAFLLANAAAAVVSLWSVSTVCVYLEGDEGRPWRKMWLWLGMHSIDVRVPHVSFCSAHV